MKVYRIFQRLTIISGPVLPGITIESQSTTLIKLFDLSINLEKLKVHNLLQSFEVRNYHLFVICSANDQHLPLSLLYGLSAVYIECRKMECQKLVQRCSLCMKHWQQGVICTTTHASAKSHYQYILNMGLIYMYIGHPSSWRKNWTHREATWKL